MVLSMLFPTLPAISSIGIGWLVLSTLLSIMFLSMLWPIMLCPMFWTMPAPIMVLSMLWPIMLCPMFWTMGAPIMVLSMLFPTLPAISSIGIGWLVLSTLLSIMFLSMLWPIMLC